MHLSPPSGLGCCTFKGGGSVVVVDSLLSVAPFVGLWACFMFCCALLCVLSSFAITLIKLLYFVFLPYVL